MTTTTLITGANKGLGHETARRLLSDGHDVWLAARDRSRGQTAADELGARFVQLDVTEVTADDVQRVFETNVFGVVRVTHAFLPLLERSDRPVIVNVSSGMGSISVTSDPDRLESSLIGIAYPASKTAVNMITTQYAKAFPQIRINAVDPGYTATDLNGRSGTQSVKEGTDAIVAMATIGPSGPTGTFVDRHGVVAW